MEIYVFISMIINVFLVLYLCFLIFNIKKDIERIDEKMRNETIRREIGFDSLWKKIDKK
tara:strand:- start:1126 stop:1302 length:177 start_codon:yes stop_codon:yes gene_type:complete